jgi:WD40 repeat protein
MSPEQARGRRVALDGRTDVYALGATLYEFLTLRPAFECEDKIELLRRIIEELPTPPRRIDPRIPVDLETIVLKAMAKEAKDRYATASEMADDLRRFLEERPIKARRPNFMDHAAKWVRRHRVAALAATLVLVLSAVGAGVGSSRYRQWADEHEAALRKEQTRADQVSQSADRRRLLHDLHTTGGPLAQAHRLILLQNSESLRAARSILSNEVQPFPDGYDPRGFTYGYLSWRANAIRQLPDPDVRVGVGTLLSPDGRFLATGHTAYERSILDARTGRLISTIRVPRETVHRRLQFSPDGGRIGMLVRDRKSSMEHAMIWETQTGRLLADLAPPRWTFGSLHLVSGNRFVTIESHWRPPGATQLWETTNSPHEVRLVLTLSESTRSGQATRDGLHYGPIGGSADGKIFDVERGVLKHQLTPGPDQNPNILHPPLISGVGFTPNGKTYVELRQREWLYYWNVETGTLRKRFKVSPLDPSSQITMSSDGLRLAVVEPKSATVRLWDHKLGWTHELAVETDAPSPHSITARFLPDDSALLLSTSVNSTCHHLTVWDVASGQKRLTCPDVRDVKKAMAWGSATPDGRGVLVSGVSKTTYWDLAASLGYDALPSHKDEGWSVAFSPDSRYLATGCDDTDDPHTIKIFDAATTKPVRAWSGGRGTVASLAYSPDGRLLASGHITDIDNVRLWDAATGRPIATLAGHKDGVRVLAFSPDGKTLASGGYDGIVRLWDPTTKTLSYEVAASEKKIQTLAFCANGRYLVSEFVKGKGLWSGIQLTNLNDPERPRVEKRIGVGCSAVVCTPDGQSIVVADHGGNVYIQEIDSEYATLFFHGGDQSVGKIALAPDGHTLAVVGGEIGRIQLWDLRTRQKFFDLKDHGTRVNSLAFSPDGKTLASTAHDGSIHLWRTEE